MRGKTVNWEKVEKEVTRATKKEYGKHPYVKPKRVAEHIYANQDGYPNFKGIPFASMRLRTTKAMMRMNWHTRGTRKKNPNIFIPPWAEQKCT